jgi:hypothetical protein
MFTEGIFAPKAGFVEKGHAVSRDEIVKIFLHLSG